MPDPSDQLRRLYEAGFDLETFERFPKAIGVIKNGAIALMEATPTGLKMIGRPGWRMGEAIGVLTQNGGRQVFQAKAEALEATSERLAAVKQLEEELATILAGRL
jgi:hypothetical protein